MNKNLAGDCHKVSSILIGTFLVEIVYIFILLFDIYNIDRGLEQYRNETTNCLTVHITFILLDRF